MPWSKLRMPVPSGRRGGEWPFKKHQPEHHGKERDSKRREEKEGKKEGGEKGRSVLRRSPNKWTCSLLAEETCREKKKPDEEPPEETPGGTPEETP